MAAKLRIGYIPEHFSTPLAFAQKYYNLDAELVREPLGSGALTARLKDDSEDKRLDICVGLTEGFVRDLAKTKTAGKNPGYGLVGTYVQSPLRWAISTGAGRDELKSVGDLKGGKVGVSRIGSGSHVMSYVLADEHGWLDGEAGKEPFEVVVLGDFKALRKGVNEGAAEFFMWEHFTTKHFWDNGELKRLGEIYTPWPSWMIAARQSAQPQLEPIFDSIDKGLQHYRDHPDEAVEYITSTMDYSEEDAREWMKKVDFSEDVTGVDPSVVDRTVTTLEKAGVLKPTSDKGHGVEDMVYILRGA